ncbi:formate dehydrogenase subunit gamma [Thiofilum flexile]|uniref:formate dehydrogenase subunit gamma n=1 Tax=Thiofilum flexile TaxID=125627 RepID=UPI00035D8367|nr:formate dehydrogenase subunit gamma [Thiofilum flexile]
MNDGSVKNPGIEFWDAVRGHEGAETGQVRSQVTSIDSTTLINPMGEEWRLYRMDMLIPTAAIVLGLTLLAIVLFRLIRGEIKIQGGYSGQKIKRFSTFQRYVHWTTAILFIVLALTGVILLFGRYIVIPVFGAEIGGTLTWLCKRTHDFAGPAFGVALLVMIITFIKGNMPSRIDLQWLLKGGGLFGKHASAGRYNAGEKAWYWTIALAGTLVVLSGLVLDFPNFDQGRNTMMYSHWVHSIGAVILIAFAMGHIYMGTIAMQGAFEAMQTGYCDSNWAKEHHDLWYADMQEAGKIDEPTNEPAGTLQLADNKS